MTINDLGSLPSGASGEVISIESNALEPGQPTVLDEVSIDPAALAQTAREQLARDIAEIERATAALRRAEPALESWTNAPVTTTTAKPRPVWLLIGALWLSAALVTFGAVVAIAALVG